MITATKNTTKEVLVNYALFLIKIKYIIKYKKYNSHFGTNAKIQF